MYPESAGAGLGARDQQAQLPPLEHRGAGLGAGVARRQPRSLQHQRRHQPPGPRVRAVRRPQRQHAPRPQAEPQQARDPEPGGAGGEAEAIAVSQELTLLPHRKCIVTLIYLGSLLIRCLNKLTSSTEDKCDCD